jgi:cytochrome b6-f complex iron-sulfur subunit
MTDTNPTRRAVVLSGVTIAALTACSSDDGTKANGETSAPPAAGTDLVAAADVPVGGAVSVDAASGPLLVSQPSEGTFVAFSAVCTHMGCTVAPGEGEFRCPCHGSVYDEATGKNVSGPAPKPLAKVDVEVVDGQVRTV